MTINVPQSLNADEFSIIRVSGEDAEYFLNNQLTVDVPTGELNIVAGAWCNPKGRVIASLHVICAQQDYLLVIHHQILDTVIKRLNLFKMRSKVVVEAENTTLMVTKEPLDKEKLGEFQQGVFKGYSIVPVDATDEALPLWSDFLIATGFPLIPIEQSEKWIAQQLNMDELAMIDFQKGCYPGQEVIARIHFKGAVKKKLSLISAENREDLNNQSVDYEVLNQTQHRVNNVHFAQIIKTII